MNKLYKNKYLKYKAKYLKLKLNQEGGMELDCPPEYKTYCMAPTEFMGLCINNSNCNDEYDETKTFIPSIIWDNNKEDDRIEQEKSKIGIKKGYVNDYLNKTCNNSYILNSYTNEHHDCTLPKQFSILTLNVMGIVKDNIEKIKLMNERISLLINEINEKNPDIMCFQEMSPQFLNELYPKIKHLYPYCHEIDFTQEKLKERRKDIEVYLISKYQPRKITIMNLDGNLGYYNSLSIFEYDNINIFNCYFQAGSKSSPGQKHKWLHYSRCRAQQFKHIEKLINSNKDKATIVLGDFNCHLDGSVQDWPELKYLYDIGLYDSWKSIHPDKPGFTEDTDLNELRFNSKFEVKKYRYDAILFNNKLNSIDSIIFGNKSKILESSELNKIYENIILPGNGLTNPQLKIAGKNQDNTNLYKLYISDHFGVMSSFVLSS